MPFTVKEFPGRIFATIAEYEQAKQLRKKAELELEQRSVQVQQASAVVAKIIPASPDVIERRLIALEDKFNELNIRISEDKVEEDRTLPPGLILYGESRGMNYSLEVLPDGYLCSDGTVYGSLSGAAQGVSGNRRSGWKFWRDEHGTLACYLTRRNEVGNG